MATRAAARGLRLLQQRGFLAPSRDAPAASSLGVRLSSSSAALPPPPPPPPSYWEEVALLRRELLEIRRETLTENHAIWDKIDEILKVNHGLRDEMVLLRAQNQKNQEEAVRTMVRTSYGILAACGAFTFSLFTVLSPLLKDNWQNEALEKWEARQEKKNRSSVAEEQSDKALARTDAGVGPTSSGRNGDTLESTIPAKALGSSLEESKPFDAAKDKRDAAKDKKGWWKV